jgi:methylmalonyl-CoA/ethylmalonyl-CoA epimerase
MPIASPTRVAQAAIPVRGLESAKRFYGGVLGLAHLFDAPPGLAFYQCGETRLMLSEAEGDDGIILYYGVGDVAEAHRAALARGAASLVEPHVIAEVEGKPIHLAILADGEGNRVGLISG